MIDKRLDFTLPTGISLSLNAYLISLWVCSRAERVLKAFSKVTLTILKDGEGRETGHWLTPLSAVQQDSLYHLGLELSLYSQLEFHNT
jgi:hypothetical protein